MTKLKKKLLVLGHDQFGESTTTFKQCEFAREKYDITYVGWDYGKPRYVLSNVNVKYVSRESNLLMRNLRLLRAFHKEIKNGYDIVFAKYTRGISIVRLFNCKTTFIAYIDTLGVMPGKMKRFIYDFAMKAELLFFKNIALINKGIGRRLGLKKFSVIPLGGDCYSKDKKSFDHLSLLYVGTLANRNVIDCVKGFHKFINKQKQDAQSVNTKFIIIGDSPFGELKEINEYIAENDLGKYIRTTGFVDRDKLEPFFENANVGVSYVPIKPHYQYQPPTKTYEYLISGLPVIATRTTANEEIVSPNSGVMISDNPEAFYQAILLIQKNKDTYDSAIIRAQYKACTWERMVKDQFIPLLEKLSA